MEIKLRVFKDGKMYGHNEAVRLMYNRDILLEKEEFEVMLFTGFTDKNGKDIYRGDLIVNYQTGDLPNKPGEVDLNYGGWHYDCYHANALPLNDIYLVSEVIGNVHENPELLK